MKKRLDEILVTKKLVSTRSQARHLIKDGTVLVDGIPATKPGQLVLPEAELTITRELYVSRGAYKLKAALEQFQINPKDQICADIGASTGGFTQVLLEKAAKKIYAIDVGHDQLAPEIRDNIQVINLEGTNVKNPFTLNQKIDLCVVDLSFISLKLVLKNIAKTLKPTGQIVILFKPQFEGGPNAVNEKGLIPSIKKAREIRDNFINWCEKQNFKLINQIESPIKGKTGNQEFLLHITPLSPNLDSSPDL